MMKYYLGIRSFISLSISLLFVGNIFALPMDVDTSFFPGSGFAGGAPSKVLILSNGRILVTGAFSSYNGQTRNGIALLESNGTLNPAFSGSWGASSINSLVQLQNGYVIMGGIFSNYYYKALPTDASYISINRGNIVKINPLDGMPDPSYANGSGANNVLFKIVDAGEGKVLIGGNFTTYNHVPRNRIARLNVDGSLDMTFDPGTGANNTIWDIAIAPDGKIYIVGDFTEYAGVSTTGIIRLNSNGTLDSTFSTPPGYKATKVTVQGDGKVVIAGGGIILGSKFNPMRLNTDGTVDTTFNTFTNESWKGANGTSVIPLLYPDGRILVGGDFRHYNGSGSRSIVRLLSNGLMDTSFNSWALAGFNDTIHDFALQPDGKIIAVGPFSGVEGESSRGIVRLEGGGTPPVVDTLAPVVTLNGSSTISLTVGDTFSDPGALWTDERDGNGTLLLASSGTVNTMLAGTYILSYWKTDTAGNRSAIVSRTITVARPTATGSTTPPDIPVITLPPVSTGGTLPGVSVDSPVHTVLTTLPTQTNIVALGTNRNGQKIYTVNNRVTNMVCPTVVQPYGESQVLATDIVSSPFVYDIKSMIMFRALEPEGQSEVYKITGIANNNSEYSPSRQVTRAEFVKMLTRSLGCHYAYTGSDSGFLDVPSSDWSAEYITFAVKKGWINGYANGTFGPNNPITRAEAAKILARSIELPATAMTSHFTDIPRGSTFIPYIHALSEAHIMNGTSATTFNPHAHISRGEVARIFYKTFLGGTR